MKAVIRATAFALLLIFSQTMTGLGSTCSTKGLECPKSKICCGDVCVTSQKVCKVPCQQLADCDSSLNETCLDGYCKCFSSSCNKLCQTASDCSRTNAYCNQTCESPSMSPTENTRPEELPLNPALLAIVTIMGVLIFSFLFCCCLSRMKSERKSLQAREAKGKLKSLGIEPRTIEVIESETFASPLIKDESQSAASSRNGILASETLKNTISHDKDKEMLISVVVESGLPPIREEDEEGEQ